jgi:hypothetical protein
MQKRIDSGINGRRRPLRMAVGGLATFESGGELRRGRISIHGWPNGRGDDLSPGQWRTPRWSMTRRGFRGSSAGFVTLVACNSDIGIAFMYHEACVKGSFD